MVTLNGSVYRINSYKTLYHPRFHCGSQRRNKEYLIIYVIQDSPCACNMSVTSMVMVKNTQENTSCSQMVLQKSLNPKKNRLAVEHLSISHNDRESLTLQTIK